MFLINKVQHTADEAAEIFGVDLAKIMKKPEFDINEARKGTKKMGQSSEISSPAGTRVPSYFNAKWEGKTIEIRYAESINQTWRGEKLVDEYFPPKVMFEGEAMLLESSDPDKALYFFLHPLQETSPFRDQVKEKWHWSFKDVAARSKKELDKFSAIRKAFNEVEKLSGEKLKIIAKGMGISGVESMEEIQVKAELSKKVQENAELFMQNLNKKEVMFRGLILNGIDRQLFKIKDTYGNKSWIWGAGKFNGSPIVDIVSNSITPVETLITHILSNINFYYSEIMNVTSALNATKAAGDFLEQSDFNLDNVLSNGAQLPPQAPLASIGGGTNEVMPATGNNSIEEFDIHDTPAPPAQQTQLSDLATPTVVMEEYDEDDIPEFARASFRKPEPKKPAAKPAPKK